MLSYKNIISTPHNLESLDDYKESVSKNVISVFNIDKPNKLIPLEGFLENEDHGALHTYNVFKKSLDIAKQLESESGISVDSSLIYIMSAMHDSGRFRLPILQESDTQKQKDAKEQKRKKAEREHARYGVAQVKLGFKKLKENGIETSIEDQQKIEDYILNHDFFNQRLDGDKYQEPKSVEGQIVRLADRISVPVEEEIQRYWETGKRLNTPYFKKDISWQERIDFNFANMGNYIKTGKFDEFTFFLALLSQKSTDFSNPILAEIYQKWSVNKQKGVDAILEIAKSEGYLDDDIKEMEELIKNYLQYFGVDF